LASQKIVGITGGIGSGKTFVCTILESMGYPVFYSDKEAKDILVSNQDVKSKICAIFTNQAYLENGLLNKPFLASQIFNDKIKLEKMNQVVHPAVRQAFIDWALKQNSSIVFNEAAILFETGIYKKYDANILVTATKDIKIKRLLKRDQTTIAEIEKRMNNQWSDDKKLKLADFEIQNNAHSMLLPQIDIILKKLSSI